LQVIYDRKVTDYNALCLIPKLGHPFKAKNIALGPYAIAVMATFFGTRRRGNIYVGEYGGIFLRPWGDPR